MGRLSKEERKRLRREAEQSARLEEFFSYVVAPDATMAKAGPDQIIEHARAVGVSLDHRPIDDMSHAFGVPAEDERFVVVVGYTTLTRDILAQAESYEWLFEDVERLQLGRPTITLRAEVNLDVVVDFLHQTMLRVLGRLTHGILISGTGNYVGEDWLAWSLDYMDDDMFKVTRVYDDPPPNYERLLQRFPQLRATDA